MITNILLIVIVLHLVIGFGWLIFKLSPRPGDKPLDEIYKDDQEHSTLD